MNIMDTFGQLFPLYLIHVRLYVCFCLHDFTYSSQPSKSILTLILLFLIIIKKTLILTLDTNNSWSSTKTNLIDYDLYTSNMDGMMHAWFP